MKIDNNSKPAFIMEEEDLQITASSELDSVDPEDFETTIKENTVEESLKISDGIDEKRI